MAQFKGNSLKKLADKYIDSIKPLRDSEIEGINITDLWEKEVYYGMLINRESININVNAKVRMGKSTVAMAIAKRVQDAMVYLKFTKNKWTIYNIARTLYELSKKMRDPDLNNIMICVDEFDDLDNTQANSTIEQALLAHFSKIQAGRYIHRIYCSPADVPDQGSDIQLIVDQPDKQTRKTKCLVYYRIRRATGMHPQLIGHIIVDVGPIIKNWVDQKIEQKFYKFNKTDKDTQLIAYWRKKDWYVDYMVRKFYKMDLVNKMGVFQARELDYADIYLTCVTKNKKFCKLKGFLSHRMIKNDLKMLFRKAVIPTTVLGDDIMSERVDGILEFYKQYYEILAKKNQLDQKLTNNKITAKDYADENQLLDDTLKEVFYGAKEQEEELRLLAELKSKFYDTTDDPSKKSK